MALRAKHDFRLQLKLGEFVQFRTGDVIPEHYYKGDSPFKDFLRDHCDGGIIRPQKQVILTPEMQRIREMPSHVKVQEEAREKIMSHPVDQNRMDDNGGQQAVGAIPQKQTGAPQRVPKMEPKRTRK